MRPNRVEAGDVGDNSGAKCHLEEFFIREEVRGSQGDVKAVEAAVLVSYLFVMRGGPWLGSTKGSWNGTKGPVEFLSCTFLAALAP